MTIQEQREQWEAERRAKAAKDWVLVTPHGPMVHRETGEGYWQRQVRLEHEAKNG